MKKTNVTHRRQFLRGAGGASLALPLLPSLLAPPRAFGSEVVPVRNRRFVAVLTEHGGISPENMYPLAAANQQTEMFPGHTIHHGRLVRKMEAERAVVSPVLAGPAGKLSEAIVSRMNVVRGLDYPFYLSHHGGGHLGNIAGNDGFGGGEAKAVQGNPNVTIDQQMAWSPSFYRNLDGVRERYLFRTNGHPNFSHSYTWSSPSTRSGSIQRTRGESNIQTMFDRLFMGGVAKPPAVRQRPLIVDGVIDAYRTLRQSNARLSNLDRQRLDDHMDRMAELQRKLAQEQVAPAACTQPSRPNPTAAASPTFFSLLNDLLAAAFVCGTTRIAVLDVRERLVNFTGNWHQDVAHRHMDANAQKILAASSQMIFQSTMLDLAHKLLVDEGGGETVLDNSLLLWTQESGNVTHCPMSIPVVTLGGAGGGIKTGHYVDCRKQVSAARLTMNGQPHFAGVTYNRMMSTVLLAMGVPSSEWEKPGKPGFGQTYVFRQYASQYSSQVLSSASDPLPIIT